jgi:hypothetical protein
MDPANDREARGTGIVGRMTDGDAERREIDAAAHSIGLVRIVASRVVGLVIVGLGMDG